MSSHVKLSHARRAMLLGGGDAGCFGKWWRRDYASSDTPGTLDTQPRLDNE